MRHNYFKIREKIRQNRHVCQALYVVQSLFYSNLGPFRRQVVGTKTPYGGESSGVALCCRIRDEAPYLREWLEYYLAAGVSHVFFYERFSTDNFYDVLKPYIENGVVTLLDNWPHFPVSPAAEHDCILRAIGKYQWVGFIDADEFVVVKDGRSIPAFLEKFHNRPGVALHWYMFGSSGHRTRPEGAVIAEYVRRASKPNRHVKCFVRPERVARCRNSHSWYFLGMQSAVTERYLKVWGSFSLPATAETAWVNHYHSKSDEEYFAKAARKSVLDTVGIRFATRSSERRAEAERTCNEVIDQSALTYYMGRCRMVGRSPLAVEKAEMV